MKTEHTEMISVIEMIMLICYTNVQKCLEMPINV